MLAAVSRVCFLSEGLGAIQRRQDVILAHDEVLLAIELDLLAAVLSEEDEVTRLDIERHPRAVVRVFAAASRDHLPLLRLFLGRIGDDDAAGGLGRFLDALDDDAIV